MKLSELNTLILVELPMLTPVRWYDVDGSFRSRGVLLRVRPEAGDCMLMTPQSPFGNPVMNATLGDPGTLPHTHWTSLEFVELDTAVLRALSQINSQLADREALEQAQALTARWRQSLAHLPPATAAPPPEFWELYTSMPGWELKADELTMHVGNIALEELRHVNSLSTPTETERTQSMNRCISRVHEVLHRPEYREYGAADTEGREAAHRLLQRWFKHLYDAAPTDLP